MKLVNQNGSSMLAVLAGLLVLGGVVFVGIRVATSQRQTGSSVPQTSETVGTDSGERLPWIRIDNEAGWQYQLGGKPPACPEPVLSVSPVDTLIATEILYPGQYRGSHYKAHGGFQFYRSNSNDITVTLPMDAYLTGITKYKDGPGDPQIILDFQHPCGIGIRFDHLHTLAGELAALADSLSVKEDTAGLPPNQPYGFYKAGTLIATGAGLYKNVKGGGLDFGLYDLRTRNTASRNPKWAALHENEAAQTFHGLCWIDYLPAADKARVMQILPLATDDRGASDYCTFAAGGSTLDYNGGNPVLQHATPNRARE